MHKLIAINFASIVFTIADLYRGELSIYLSIYACVWPDAQTASTIIMSDGDIAKN